MQLAVLEWRIVISSVFGIEKMWNDMLWWYSIDLIAWCPASYVCCVCIDPLPICFLAVMNELAIYSYMSECSCFKLMNYNPTFKFKFVTIRKCKGVDACHYLRECSYVLANYGLPGRSAKIETFSETFNF